MKNPHWLLLGAIGLAVIAYFRSGWAAVPAVLLAFLWISECYSRDAHTYLKHDRAGLTPAGAHALAMARGKRAAALGICPRIYLANESGRLHPHRGDFIQLRWRCIGGGVIGYGVDRVDAFDDWEAKL